MSEVRSWPARIGIAALNLLAPGLGLLRIGALRSGVAFLMLWPLSALLLLAYYSFGPTVDLTAFAVAVVVLILAILGGYIGSIWCTIIWSRERAQDLRWWSRWYGLLLAVVLLFVANWLLSDANRSRYKSYYIPSESMTPTLQVYEKFVVDMRRHHDWKRDDLIVFRVQGQDRVARIVALPGDRFAMAAGIPAINGVSATQSPRTGVDLSRLAEQTEARAFEERLPGAHRTHIVVDTGSTVFDDYPEVIIRPNHVFVLGDNRDSSADSRVPAAAMGAEQVPFANILGKVRFIYWSHDRSRLGTVQ